MSDIIFLSPVFKQQIWGGNKLKTKWNYDVPGDNTGECWAISSHANGSSIIASGKYKGQTLKELFSSHRELFGSIEGDSFPLLVKIIDANQDLSIQVHPDNEYAFVHENKGLGKTECWYVLDAPENGKIVIGHNASTKEELREMTDSGRWSDLIREIPVKKGDFIQIDPGTVHAIKAGTEILEIQQNSDITYRLYDYDRIYQGKKRDLHIDKAIDVITVPSKNVEESVKNLLDTPKNTLTELIACKYYTAWKADVDEIIVINNDRPFMTMSVIDGAGSIKDLSSDETYSIKKGDHFIIPATVKNVEIIGELSLIASSI